MKIHISPPGAAALLLVVSSGCGSSLPPLDQAVCDPGTTKLDGICVEQKIANYVGCIRARAATLSQDKGRELNAAAGYAGMEARVIAEAKDRLEKKYDSLSDVNQREIINDCYNGVFANGPLPPKTSSGEQKADPPQAPTRSEPMNVSAILAENPATRSTQRTSLAPARDTPSPATLVGSSSSLAALTKSEIILRERIHFDFDSEKIKPESSPVLDAVADILLRDPTLRIEIQAHSDSKGSQSYNVRLSARRAAWVLQYLVAKGIDASRLSSFGYGSQRPLATNQTDEGRALNRRIQLVRITNEPPGAAPTPGWDLTIPVPPQEP